MNKITSEVETITPQKAREYLGLNKVNRPLNKKQVEFYASQMARGQWRLNGEAICFTEDGKMANGQHRLNAIIKSGVSVDMLVVRGCDNDSFTTYDSGRTRKVGDVFALSGISHHNNITAIIKKYFLIEEENAFMGSRADVKSDLKKTNKDFLDEYYESEELYNKVVRFSKSCYDNTKLISISDIGSVYVFLVKGKGYDSKYVQRFFRMLVFGEDVSNNTINLLRNRLIREKLSLTKTPNRYKSVLFVKTWNCYVSHKELKTLSWDEKREGKIKFL